jgi:hypothetical protein
MEWRTGFQGVRVIEKVFRFNGLTNWHIPFNDSDPRSAVILLLSFSSLSTPPFLWPA